MCEVLLSKGADSQHSHKIQWQQHVLIKQALGQGAEARGASGLQSVTPDKMVNFWFSGRPSFKNLEKSDIGSQGERVTERKQQRERQRDRGGRNRVRGKRRGGGQGQGQGQGQGEEEREECLVF